MERLRLQRLSGQLLQARCSAAPVARLSFASSVRRQLSTTAARGNDVAASASAADAADLPPSHPRPQSLPSPPPHRAAQSAKLAALHARLSLSKKIPLETLARALIAPSADKNPNFNNANLAFLGSTFISYHVMEHLVCKWPRLPMAILYEALRAYSGRESLHQVGRRWGVEEAAAPGEEVDPGLLQWAVDEGSAVQSRWGYIRSEDIRAASYESRRGMSSRVVLDDDFGDSVNSAPAKDGDQARTFYMHEAYSTFVQAVVGSIYTHSGREAARDFVQANILSRHIDLSSMFQFQLPTRELSMLCAREGLPAPTARLESETGRRSRTPVFVVGIYSGQEKLGEGSGASLNIARWKASMNALKAWYLYSPGNKVRVPSDMFEENAKPWKAPHIDVGEVV